MKKYFVLTVSLLFLFSCKQEDETNIPDARVYICIQLNNYSAFKNGIGAHLTCPGDLLQKDLLGTAYGYGGVILYHTMDTDRPFAAYDRCCPYEVKQSVKINVDKNGQGVCPQCGSVFDLLSGYGNVISGKAKYPLRSYTVHIRTSVVHGDELQVTD